MNKSPCVPIKRKNKKKRKISLSVFVPKAAYNGRERKYNSVNNSYKIKQLHMKTNLFNSLFLRILQQIKLFISLFFKILQHKILKRDGSKQNEYELIMPFSSILLV